MYTRVVTEPLHERFAALSGDRNPMHMDAVAARRTQAGLPVVHGIHTMLWALETSVAESRIVTPPTRLRAKFLRWVYLGDVADLTLDPGSTNPARLQVEVMGMPVLTIDLSYSELTASSAFPAPSPAAPLPAALDLSFAQLEGHTGDAYTAPATEAERDFPVLSALIGPSAVAELAACSYIVGMEVPGLHSMFSKLDLTLHIPSPRAALHYAVTSQDERFRKARITVEGSSITGTLDAFIRIPPVQQAAMEAVQTRVTPGEFAHINALIIGGSRGLGELTAKILAAGGAISTITYALGKVEAGNLAAELRATGSIVETMQYDVRKPPAGQLGDAHTAFTHMFYFATNAIFRPKGGLVSPPILTDFIAFYVQGFHDLCVELLRINQLPAGAALVVYYPSSIAVTDRPAGMTEYSMAKAAGEEMVRDMNQHVAGIRILTTRLPRLHTDQTTGLLPGKDVDPIDVMLPILREMALR